jgi:23S rRNA (guanosine2251-2'-O)-methyltransferase
VIVYGRNAVHEAIRGPRAVKRVWATTGAAREPWLAAAGAGVAVSVVSVVSAEEIASRCGSEAHQGICADVAEFRYGDADALLRLSEPLLVVLDQVQDPQNLGSICRTAECAGAAGVIIPERRSAVVTPAVCKASAGAVEHLPVAIVRNVTDFLTAAKRAGLWCYGADAGATTPYDEVDYSGGAVLVLGSEGSGLRPRVASACDALVSLPIRGRIESLGVGAAAAVLLYRAGAGRNRSPSA